MLTEGASRIGIDLRPDLLESLIAYTEELSLWNRKENLVRADERNLVLRHLLDSLAIVPHLSLALDSEVPRDRSIVDVGSGAGLPGIPVAIVLPGVEVVLLDRSSKRCAFLDTIRLLLKLRNVSVFEGEADAYTRRHSVVMCRAFRKADDALPTLKNLVADGGSIFIMSGRAGVDAPSESDRPELLPIRVPFLDAERHLLVLATDFSTE